MSEPNKVKTLLDYQEKVKKSKQEASTSDKDNKTDYIRKALEDADKPVEKKFKGYYLDKDVADTLDEYRDKILDASGGKRRNSGSALVNQILRDYLVEHGYL